MTRCWEEYEIHLWAASTRSAPRIMSSPPASPRSSFERSGPGVDAQHAHAGPGLLGKPKDVVKHYLIEPAARKFGRHFVAGDNPSQVIDWAVECVAKAGTIAIIGVYPPSGRVSPIGKAMNKNLTLRMGNANRRRYYDVLLDHVTAGRLDPQKVLTETEPMTGAIEAYKANQIYAAARAPDEDGVLRTSPSHLHLSPPVHADWHVIQHQQVPWCPAPVR